MTPLQKRRHSTMRQGRRRATFQVKLPSLTACENCHQPTPLHKACSHCGYYRGRKVTTR